VRRAGLAALGVSAAAPVVGAASAGAAGTSPAYTDSPNTFTEDQTVAARLGVGRSPLYPLHVVRSDDGAAVNVDASHQAFVGRHTVDHGGATFDLVDLFHKSAGDALFVAHMGGRPPGFTDQTGGNAGLNVLVPYYLDAPGDGRSGGTVPNDRTGMRGLKIQTMPTNSDVVAIDVLHWGNSYSAYFGIQPNARGEPQGTGGGLLVDDWSTASSIKIGKYAAPRAGEAAINVLGSGGSAAPFQALRVTDGSAVRASLRTDGTLALGTGSPFAVRLQAEMPASGVARNLALSNSQGTGAQLEFDDANARYATITSTFDSTSQPRNGSLSLSVVAGNSMTERLKLNATGIGFFGATPVARPAVSGSRKGNDALASLLTALARLGLVSDSTTG
jgi:hypothetical protein